MPRVFVSHSSRERGLAEYIASWLEEVVPDTNCFCSSRPTDLPPGADWLREIQERSTNSDLCLLLLSPDSALNNWLHFEAGMVLGADINNKAVPALYGGMDTEDVPPTLRHLQALSIDDSLSFNAFMSTRLLGGEELTPEQNHEGFISGMNSSILRLLRFGAFGLLVDQNVTTQIIGAATLVNENEPIIIPKVNEDGRLVAVRAKIIPRRVGPVQHWKFGMELRMWENEETSVRVFQFHSGCHEGLNSWTIYFTPTPHVPINEPARLDTERPSTLQLWLSNDGWSAGCVGIDSYGRRTVLINDRGENRWRLRSNSWTEVVIAGWADGAQFQIDIEGLEVDRAP